jgi:hypothetical protein
MVSNVLPDSLKQSIDDKLIKPHPETKDVNEHYALLKEAYYDIKNGKSVLREGKNNMLRFGLPRAPGVNAKKEWSLDSNDLANSYFLKQTETFLNRRNYPLVEITDVKMPINDNVKSDFKYVEDDLMPQMGEALNDAYTEFRENHLTKTQVNGIDVYDHTIDAEKAVTFVDLVKKHLKIKVASTGHYGILNTRQSRLISDDLVEGMFNMQTPEFTKYLMRQGKIDYTVAKALFENYLKDGEEKFKDNSVKDLIKEDNLDDFVAENTPEFPDAANISTVKDGQSFAKQYYSKKNDDSLEKFLKSLKR